MYRPSVELRKLRYAANLTQERLAEIAHTSRITIQNRESGRFRPDERQRPHYAAALGISLGELNQVLDGKLSAEECLARKRDPGPPLDELVCTLSQLPHPPCDARFAPEDPTNRRQFIAMVLTGGPGAMAAALETVRGGLLSTVGEHSQTPLHADDWAEVTWEYGRSYLTTSSDALIVDLAIDLLELHDQLRRAANDPLRRELSRAAALLSALMAKCLTNIGQVHGARRWWGAARQSAHASEDPYASAWVRGEEAIGSLYTHHRDPARALAIVEEALAIGSSEGNCTVLAAKAQALALLRRDEDARRSVQSIAAAFDQMPMRVTGDELTIFGWPESCLRHTESYVYSHIGDTATARRAQDQALRLYAGTEVRTRTLVQLHGALCFAQEGHLDDAGEAAVAAIGSLPPSQRSVFIRQLAQHILATIPAPHRTRPALTELASLISPASTLRA